MENADNSPTLDPGDTGKKKTYKSEILVACIGLAGVIFTGFVSNIEKIFPQKNTIQTEYTGYRPTGNFETELRYFMEVSGQRKAIETMQEQMFKAIESRIDKEDPSSIEKFRQYEIELKTLSPRFENIIKICMPVFSKYYTTEELQELNKFYSTPIMQAYTQKSPLISQEMAPALTAILLDLSTKNQKLIEKYFPDPAKALGDALLKTFSERNEGSKAKETKDKAVGQDSAKRRSQKM